MGPLKGPYIPLLLEQAGVGTNYWMRQGMVAIHTIPAPHWPDENGDRSKNVLTDKELQDLRNLGGLSEDAAIEIETLRAARPVVRFEMNSDHQVLLKHHAQCEAEYRAWRSPFIVRASLMFNVPVSEVTPAMYAAAVEQTQRDTMPPGVGGS